MKLFHRKNKNVPEEIRFRPEKENAVLHCSICTGEMVAGFKEKETGKFHEVALIKNDTELEAFKKRYGITEVKKEY